MMWGRGMGWRILMCMRLGPLSLSQAPRPRALVSMSAEGSAACAVNQRSRALLLLRCTPPCTTWSCSDSRLILSYAGASCAPPAASGISTTRS